MASSSLALNFPGPVLPRSKKNSFDVFLSFRGTKTSFTDRLSRALVVSGLKTYPSVARRDNTLKLKGAIRDSRAAVAVLGNDYATSPSSLEELEKTYSSVARRDLSSELKGAIRDSRTAVAVLGNDYATSQSSLEELEHILECHGQRKTVIPVFYNVDPSDVRYQTGSFAEAFARHEETYKDDPDKVRRWRDALTKVANISGWVSKGRDESELVKDIVDDVWSKLQPVSPSTIPFSSLDKISTPSSSPFSSHKRKYDVFMCFRGKDTRLNIVGHTYASLKRKRINPFRDDKGLEKGQPLWSGIVKAIEESQIYLVTLSPDFASSTWCLDELVKMFECMETSNSQRSLEAFTERKEASTVVTGLKCNTRDRKTNKLRLLVNYDGKWSNSIYSGGKTKGIMVPDGITHAELVQRLYNILGVDPSEHKIIITAAYASKLPTQPVELIDDDDLTYFIEESLSFGDGTKLPLCITLQPAVRGVCTSSQVKLGEKVMSGFPSSMETSSKLKWSKNGFRKWKAVDRHENADAALLPSTLLTRGINACLEKNKSCLDGCDECYDKPLYGWYGAIQRQHQRSQYYVQYSWHVREALWIVILLFLIGKLHKTLPMLRCNLDMNVVRMAYMWCLSISFFAVLIAFRAI